MKRLLLLRHGPTAASGQAPAGQADDPLLPAAWGRWPGVRDVLCAAQPTRILCSDLRRCREPAADLAAALAMPLHIEAALREQDFGAWTGRPWDHLGAEHPFWTDPVHALPPGGESFAACAERARAAVRAWIAASDVADETLVIVAHAGPLRAILGDRIGLPLDRCLDCQWSPWGLSEVHDHGARACLVSHNLVPAVDGGSRGHLA